MGVASNGTDPHFVGEAEFDFHQVQQGELSFRKGQRIILAPKELQPRIRGWLLACVDGENTGLVPANYIKVLGKREGRQPLPVPGAVAVKTPNVNASGAVGDSPCTEPDSCSETSSQNVTASKGCCSTNKSDELNTSNSHEMKRNFSEDLEDFSNFSQEPNVLPVSEIDASEILNDNDPISDDT